MRIDDALGRYIEFAKSSFPRNLTLDGLRIVVDCAHGAAYKSTPCVLRELGAQVIVYGNQPDGSNINKDCGSMHPEHLCRLVREHKAHLGLAHDGDADRVFAVRRERRAHRWRRHHGDLSRWNAWPAARLPRKPSSPR